MQVLQHQFFFGVFNTSSANTVPPPFISGTEVKGGPSMTSYIGEELIINGTNLFTFCCKYDTGIYINSKGPLSLNEKIISENRISFIVPNNLEEGNSFSLYITTNSGISNIVNVKVIPKLVSNQLPKPYISSIEPKSAKVGELVTVRGSNLFGNSVYLNDYSVSSDPVNYSYDASGNSLVFTVPKGYDVGRYNLKVEQRVVGGFSNSLPFEIIAQTINKQPVISSVESKVIGAGNVVSGEKAYIHGSGLLGPLTIQLGTIEPKYVYTRGTSDTYAEFVVPYYTQGINLDIKVTNSTNLSSSPYPVRVSTTYSSAGTTSVAPVMVDASNSDLNQVIKSLLEQIQALQAQLNERNKQTTNATNQFNNTNINASCLIINRDLAYREKDGWNTSNITGLQDFLQSSGYLNSEPTGYFGLMTLDAVKRFQSAHSINSTGLVGPMTRAKIQELSCR